MIDWHPTNVIIFEMYVLNFMLLRGYVAILLAFKDCINLNQRSVFGKSTHPKSTHAYS